MAEGVSDTVVSRRVEELVRRYGPARNAGDLTAAWMLGCVHRAYAELCEPPASGVGVVLLRGSATSRDLASEEVGSPTLGRLGAYALAFLLIDVGLVFCFWVRWPVFSGLPMTGPGVLWAAVVVAALGAALLLAGDTASVARYVWRRRALATLSAKRAWLIVFSVALPLVGAFMLFLLLPLRLILFLVLFVTVLVGISMVVIEVLVA